MGRVLGTGIYSSTSVQCTACFSNMSGLLALLLRHIAILTHASNMSYTTPVFTFGHDCIRRPMRIQALEARGLLCVSVKHS